MKQRSLPVLALALPAWIVMILAGGGWCLMPASASVRHMAAVTSMTSVNAPRSAHVSHDAHVSHTMTATLATRATSEVHESRGLPASHEIQFTQNRDAERADTAPVPAPHQSHHSGDSRACTSATPCSVAVAPSRWTMVDLPSLPAAPSLLAADRLTSIALAPELPPPRA